MKKKLLAGVGILLAGAGVIATNILLMKKGNVKEGDKIESEEINNTEEKAEEIKETEEVEEKEENEQEQQKKIDDSDIEI